MAGGNNKSCSPNLIFLQKKNSAAFFDIGNPKWALVLKQAEFKHVVPLIKST